MKSEIVSKTTVERSKIHFQFLDGLRAFAALWVILFHSELDGSISQFTGALPQWFVHIVFERGSLGVAIFFVLSGFLIAHSLQNTKLDFARFKNFTLRRFVRLNPTYYVSILSTLAIGFIAAYVQNEEFAPMAQPLSFPRLIAHLFYLQDIFKLHHIDEVYWTLCLEVQYYLVFFILLGFAQWLDSYWKNNWGKVVIFVPSAVIAALYPIRILQYDGRPTIFLPLWYSFLLGVFAYWTWRNSLKPWFFYFYAALISVGTAPSSGFVITSSLIAILLLEVARANCMQNLFNWQWVQFLSKISYSLYLTHVSILGGVYWVVFKVLKHNIWSEFFGLLVAIGACLGFATLIWQFVEKPSIQWSKKLKRKEATNV